jgi:hypothetical protein
MAIDHTKSILENAYNLWKSSTSANLPQSAPDTVKRILKTHEIANTLFTTLLKKKWYRGFPFACRIWKKHIVWKVKRALAAHKFDRLTSSSSITNELWLFKDKEKTLVTELRPLFRRNLLHRKGVNSISAKASRWKNKVHKYHDNPRYLVASLTLTVITERHPGIKKPINQFLKPVKPLTIKEYTDWMLEGQDPAVEQGIATLLGKPDFDPQVPFNTLFKEAIYEIGVQKVKNVARETGETISYYANAAKNKVTHVARWLTGN